MTGTGSSVENEILAAVAIHARTGHGMSDVPAEVVDQVRSNIRLVSV